MVLHSVICPACGDSFEAARPEANSCSSRCRSRLSRSRQLAAAAARDAATAAEVARTATFLRSLRAVAGLVSED